MNPTEPTYVFHPPHQASVAVSGGGRFPVRRIFCIGRNYADHVREMGADPKSAPPVFFTKPADAVTVSGSTIPYPPGTADFHYEGELVVALHAAGRNLADVRAAEALIFGFAAGCDLTRRDLQAQAKKSGAPWDSAKAFDHSAPLGAIARKEMLPASFLDEATLSLSVNGASRQSSALRAMIWSTADIIMALSRLFALEPGDLIFTGTPEGVGPLMVGDAVEISIDALPGLRFSIGPKA